MTKGRSFKQAIRRRARAAGKSYTEVLAALQTDEAAGRVDAATRWHAAESLPGHLESRYGIRVDSVARLSPHGAGVFRVARTDGPAWVARIFPPGSRSDDRIAGDAEILRFLEAHAFPAERCAHAEPISTHEGQQVLVTTFVPGRPGEVTAEHEGALAAALGRLHALPAGTGAATRAGGAFGHDPHHEGTPGRDLDAALGFLDAVAPQVQGNGLRILEALQAEIVQADRCDDLPEALTTPNVGDRDVIVSADGERVFVDWKPAGRGARLPALAFLLHAALRRAHPAEAPSRSGPDVAIVEAIVSSYSRHVKLEAVELTRLPGAMRIHPYYFAAWYYWRAVANGRTPDGTEGWWPNHELTDALADLAARKLAVRGRS